MHLKHIAFSELAAKQREIYNFQKVASLLADYGFNCIKLDDDWQGADFLAYPKDGSTTLKVQLKGRVTIAGETTPWLQSQSWTGDGLYSSDKPSKRMLDRLSSHALEPNDSAVSS